MATVFGVIDGIEHAALHSLLLRQLRLTPHHEKFPSRRFKNAASDELSLCDELAHRRRAIRQP
jgi:hypothetical protein